MALPPRQRAIDHFPRFGAPASARRMPRLRGSDLDIRVETPGGGACAPITLAELAARD